MPPLAEGESSLRLDGWEGEEETGGGRPWHLPTPTPFGLGSVQFGSGRGRMEDEGRAFGEPWARPGGPLAGVFPLPRGRPPLRLSPLGPKAHLGLSLNLLYLFPDSGVQDLSELSLKLPCP